MPRVAKMRATASAILLFGVLAPAVSPIRTGPWGGIQLAAVLDQRPQAAPVEAHPDLRRVLDVDGGTLLAETGGIPLSIDSGTGSDTRNAPATLPARLPRRAPSMPRLSMPTQ